MWCPRSREGSLPSLELKRISVPSCFTSTRFFQNFRAEKLCLEEGMQFPLPAKRYLFRSWSGSSSNAEPWASTEQSSTCSSPCRCRGRATLGLSPREIWLLPPCLTFSCSFIRSDGNVHFSSFHKPDSSLVKGSGLTRVEPGVLCLPPGSAQPGKAPVQPGKAPVQPRKASLGCCLSSALPWAGIHPFPSPVFALESVLVPLLLLEEISWI